MVSEAIIVRRVEFSETDLAGIVHFTNYLKWMEAAEAEFFTAAGHPLVAESDGVLQGWPRVEVSASYRAPLRFGDRVEVRLRLVEMRASALRWSAEFRRLDSQGGTLSATALMTTLHARMDRASGLMRAALIPDALRARIGVAPDAGGSENNQKAIPS